MPCFSLKKARNPESKILVKSLKFQVFWKSIFGNYPRGYPPRHFRSLHFASKSQKNTGFLIEIRCFHGIPTARGYNAPCFEGMVHYYIGSVLMLLDNEDEKDKVSIVLAIQNEPKARYYYTSSGCFWNSLRSMKSSGDFAHRLRLNISVVMAPEATERFLFAFLISRNTFK